MNPFTISLGRTSPRRGRWKSGARIVCVMLAIGASTTPVVQAQSSSEADGDHQMVQALLQRISQLEARLARLEAAQPAGSGSRASGPAAASTPSSLSSAHETATQAEGETEPSMGGSTEPERMDVSKTLLRVRGFGDINFHGDTQKGDKTAFTLGQLNLFVTSDISDKFRFLGEIVFEAGPENIYGKTRGESNSFGVDIERMVLQYSLNDYFNLSVGRYHTAIGYYNTAYHHSTWFQTATGRPFLFQFEDGGGILPIHTVGVSATGQIPSGRLGLHYVAEVGNGRASRDPLDQEPVQNIVDDQNRKAFNLAVFARPEAIRGLQTGFSIYRNVLAPNESPRVGETILAAHAVYITSSFEWLNEALLVRHAVDGTSQVFNTPGFYTQISRRFGAYRPYFRYQYVNGSDHEPIFPDVGRRQGPSAGIRFDASESVALKLQYDYTSIRNQQAISALAMQVGFTF